MTPAQLNGLYVNNCYRVEYTLVSPLWSTGMGWFSFCEIFSLEKVKVGMDDDCIIQMVSDFFDLVNGNM